MNTAATAPARTDHRDKHRQQALEAALEYAAYGWPVLPGATWDGRRYLDPATGNPTHQIQPTVPRSHASTDPATITAWWSADTALSPTVLLRSGLAFDVFSVARPVADPVVRSPRFRAAPGPLVYRPDRGRAYFLVTPGEIPPGGFHFGPRVAELLPSGSWIVAPPARLAIGVNTTWWAHPNEVDGKPADFILIHELLTGAARTASTPPIGLAY